MSQTDSSTSEPSPSLAAVKSAVFRGVNSTFLTVPEIGSSIVPLPTEIVPSMISKALPSTSTKTTSMPPSSSPSSTFVVKLNKLSLPKSSMSTSESPFLTTSRVTASISTMAPVTTIESDQSQYSSTAPTNAASASTTTIVLASIGGVLGLIIITILYTMVRIARRREEKNTRIDREFEALGIKETPPFYSSSVKSGKDLPIAPPMPMYTSEFAGYEAGKQLVGYYHPTYYSENEKQTMDNYYAHFSYLPNESGELHSNPSLSTRVASEESTLHHSEVPASHGNNTDEASDMAASALAATALTSHCDFWTRRG